MDIKSASRNVLSQLDQVIHQIEKEDYVRQIATLSGSTLGQHIRHTLEFFTCLKEGCLSGIVNYDERNRDLTIEENPEIASDIIGEIISFLEEVPDDLPLLLRVNYELEEVDNQSMKSNFTRELTYNIEHAIHHMAILKIGLAELTPYVTIPDGFGVAASTLRYRQENALETDNLESI